MRRNEKFLTAMAAAFMTTAAVSFSSMAAVDTDFHRFVVGTIINGVPVSGMTTADAEAYIEGYFNGGYTLEIEDTEGVREAITDTSIGYTVDVTGDLEAILKEENDGGRVSGPGVEHRYTVDAELKYDEAALRALLENMAFVKNASPTSDAYITPYEEGKAFSIVPEVQGTEIDMDKLMAAVKDAYAAGVTDEFIEPVICDGDGTISDNDSVIFFNYRPDRAREITRTLVDPKFDGFTRQYFPVTFVCTTEYDATMPNVEVAYPRQAVRNGLGEYLSNLGLTQLRIAETEKYAHVTFFFNGGVETQFPGEDRVLVPSPKVATYDLQPEMSAYEVCDKCVERIESGAYDVIILNFANCDMVGHTGVFDAAVKAVETVDECVGKVVDATMKMGGIAMITADHGNAETMTQEDGSPMTAHTTDLVPFILCGAGSELRQGRLADIAPTILDVMGLAAPEEMDGQTLIVK